MRSEFPVPGYSFILVRCVRLRMFLDQKKGIFSHSRLHRTGCFP